MNIKKILKSSVTGMLISCVVLSQSVNAASCSELITKVISHSSGNIYFYTDKTCPNWCMLPGNSAFATQSYAMLMVAQAKKRPLLIAWPNLPSCEHKNELYAVPDYFVAGD